MAWTEDYRAGHVTKYFDGDGSATTVPGITNVRVQSGTEVSAERASGSPYPDSVAHRVSRPMIAFTTGALEDVIGAFGINGTCITNDGGTAYGLYVFGQKQDCSGVASGSVHRRFLVETGTIVPRSLTVDHLGSASMVYEAYPSWDGTNDPIQVSDTAAMPTYPAETWPTPPIGRWTMRGLTVESTSVTGKRNVSIDFNPTVTHEGADSDKYPTVTSISSLEPRVVVRGVDPTWLSDVAGLDGDTLTHANSTLELQQRGTAIGTASHIKLTFAGLVTFETIFDAGNDAPGETAMVLTCAYDGTNAPVTVTTGQTLS